MSDSKGVDRRSQSPAVVQVSSSARTIRETVESIVIAFVLAFLFRTFEAEAFVIPTGSMAPTLQGRHKDIECPKCGRQYQVSASVEAADNMADRRPVVGATCPQCGFHLEVGANSKDGDFPSYNGDRILVGKFSYEFGEPKRWDVIVFKYPEDAKINYIKRLVGLPGETIRITEGNIYTRGPHQPAELQDQFVIQRKPHDKLRAMLQMVYDNQHQPEELIAAGWPANWQPDPAAPGEWTITSGNREFATDQPAGSQAWLRYHHIIPSRDAWRELRQDQPLTRPEPKPVTDRYAYNSYETSPRNPFNDGDENWVGDLAVEFDLQVKEARGEVFIELVRGGTPLLCRINLQSGECTFSSPALPGFGPKATTAINTSGKYHILFTNVDDELRLYVDGEPVQFDSPTAYEPTKQMFEAVGHGWFGVQPGANDTAPVAIGADGAAVEISGLKVLRDIYYTSLDGQGPPPGSIEFELKQYADEPQLDQFFVLGDNSPQSKDSRLWEDGQHYVERKLLIGKALWIYWPHSFGYVEIGDTHIPFPFFPNVRRMGYVR